MSALASTKLLQRRKDEHKRQFECQYFYLGLGPREFQGHRHPDPQYGRHQHSGAVMIRKRYDPYQFTKAAQLIDRFVWTRDGRHPDGACIAIHWCTGGCGHPAVDLFARMFRDDNSRDSIYWMAPPLGFTNNPIDEKANRDLRVYALLLAANAWEDFRGSTKQRRQEAVMGYYTGRHF